jgi:hypothetical protein
MQNATSNSQAAADDWAKARRRAGLVTGVAGLGLPLSVFVTLLVVGQYRANYVPGIDAPSGDFVTFYADNFSKIRLTATLTVWSTVLVLVLFISLIRYISGWFDLLGTLAVALAASATAVSVAGQALFASPTLVFEMTDSKIADNLDAGVARTLIAIPDTLDAVSGILFGLAFIALGIMIFGSDIVGRRFLAVSAGLMGVFGAVNLVLGGGGGFITIILWGVPAAVLVLISRSRLMPREVTDRPESEAMS